jgi:hypothetical protein
MLAFRSEGHARRWCEEQGIEPGATFGLDTCWRLAHAWYEHRLDADWRRRTPDEAQAVFAGLGLVGDFWRL